MTIRAKLAIWFSFILSLLVALTFGIVRIANSIVLHTTIRNYLISTVEENAKMINYVRDQQDTLGNIYIAYEDGYLEVDEDFLDVVNDVYCGLYSEDGTMLYGENLFAQQEQQEAFTTTHTWHINEGNQVFDLYDRKLNLEFPEGKALWIRGATSEANSTEQLREISRISWILFPILIGLAIIISYLLTSRLLRPIRTIEQTATHISRGSDLKQRIQVGNKNDEVGHLAQAFNHMIERLDNAFEAERRFTSDASHELRTPTSVILAQAEYTLEKPRTDEEYRDALEVVQRQGKRMSHLINDMLDYTRMDQRPERYQMEEVNFSDIVRDMTEQMGTIHPQGIRLVSEITPGLCVHGNAMLLSNMAQNLISNAFRYGKPGGHVWVHVETGGENDDRVILSVRDDGIGIAKEEQEKIFERFYRSDASRTVQGTGLGLSMVKKIAAMHDAEVLLSSELGQGTEFRIILRKS